jgi:hypothetical protein
MQFLHIRVYADDRPVLCCNEEQCEADRSSGAIRGTGASWLLVFFTVD